MKEFFASMDGTQQFYWYVAIAASVIFIIQTIMTFVGADTDTGVDADFDGNLDDAGSPFQLFSLRNLVNFLLGFGWGGVTLYDSIGSKFWLGVVAFLIGASFIFIFFLVMRALFRLSEDNSFRIESTLGKTADVYLTIPAEKKGKGKVFISINGSTRELSAITTAQEDLKVGSLVKVVELDGDILVVTPL